MMTRISYVPCKKMADGKLDFFSGRDSNRFLHRLTFFITANYVGTVECLLVLCKACSVALIRELTHTREKKT